VGVCLGGGVEGGGRGVVCAVHGRRRGGGVGTPAAAFMPMCVGARGGGVGTPAAAFMPMCAGVGAGHQGGPGHSLDKGQQCHVSWVCFA
jgi:hypothetical protein